MAPIGSTARRACGSGRSAICWTPCGNSAPTRSRKPDNGCPPVVVRARGLAGGRATVGRRHLQPVPQRAADGGALCQRRRGTGRRGELVSQPYVDMTLAVMASFGVRVGTDEPRPVHDCRPAALSRPALRHRARRLGRQLFLRRRGDHAGRGDGRGPFARQPARRRGLLRLPRADGLRGSIRPEPHHRRRAARCAASTST